MRCATARPRPAIPSEGVAATSIAAEKAAYSICNSSATWIPAKQVGGFHAGAVGRLRSLLRRSGKERPAMLGQERDQPHARRPRTAGRIGFFARDEVYPIGAGLGRTIRHCRDPARHLRPGPGAMPQPNRARSARAPGGLARRQRQDRSLRSCARHRTGGSPAASLLLRLRAVLGSDRSASDKSSSDEPEVLGACYGGILRIEGSRAIPWVRRFLAASDDNAGEAALAIAGTHSPEAFEILREAFVKAPDPWWRSVLLSAISLTRQDAALEFLLELVRTESLDAEAAIEAVLRSMPSQEVINRLEKLAGGIRA